MVFNSDGCPALRAKGFRTASDEAVAGSASRSKHFGATGCDGESANTLPHR
jgi:hypothetical protein